MAISVGVIVANIYYIQPLLAAIAREFSLSVEQAGTIAMLSQIGTAIGMLLFVPLGDTRERKGLIQLLLGAATVSLVLMATARSVTALALAGMAIGLSGATVHIIVPFAAHLAPPESRGRVVGSVISGILAGILLARTFSGFVGAHFGWRVVYWIAAGLMLALLAAVRRLLPRSEPSVSMRYPDLLRSILQLAREHAELREAAILGALFFGAFSAFWTTLIFRLETPPFHYGSEMAGLFGLIGAVGALGAPMVGRLADRHGPRTTVMYAVWIALASFVILWIGGNTLAGLILGVLVLDLGVQAGHVSNQTRIYNLAPEARGRLNTVYMVCYFLGGSLGSLAGAWGWRAAQWPGVCAVGIVGLAAALVAMAVNARALSGRTSQMADR